MEKWETWSQDCVAELLRVITSSCRHEILMRVTWIWDTTSSFRMWWWWQTRGTRTDPDDCTSEDAGFRSEQSAERRSQAGWVAGWLAGWADSYLEDRLSQQRWSLSTSHKSSDSESPGWAVSEAILPALGFAPRRLLGGQRLGGALTLSAAWKRSFFPLPTGLGRTWSRGRLRRIEAHSIADLYPWMWNILICLSSVFVADKKNKTTTYVSSIREWIFPASRRWCSRTLYVVLPAADLLGGEDQMVAISP